MPPHPKTVHTRQRGRGSRLLDYLPLLVITAASFASGYAQSRANPGDRLAWLTDGMGCFLITLSLFKFFDLAGFADGFQMYDVLARRARPYAYVYPFIELGLGLAYVAHFHLPAVFAATVIVMGFGALGVVQSLVRGLDIECACMGTVLHVPLSTVTLTEDLGMAVMAGAMWWSLAK